MSPTPDVNTNPNFEGFDEIREAGAKATAALPQEVQDQIARRFAQARERARLIESGALPSLSR